MSIIDKITMKSKKIENKILAQRAKILKIFKK